MPRALPLLVALLLLALPATAFGQGSRQNAPPGNSAVDEYLETVPGATGDRSPQAPAAAGGGGGGTLSAAERARLERLGPDGKALADVVDATSPRTPSKAAPEPATAQGRSPIGEVIDVATGDDGGAGMGALLPAILLASLLGAIALVLVRRRSAS